MAAFVRLPGIGGVVMVVNFFFSSPGLDGSDIPLGLGVW